MLQRRSQQLVLQQISQVLNATTDGHAERLVELFDSANRIFICGAGRSRLVGSFLAMRLMHAGYDVNVVGEIATPAITMGDVLLVISGSGETKQLVAFGNRARALDANVVLISAKADSTLARLATNVFQVGADDVYEAVEGMPMGTVFELSTLCFLEALIAHIIWKKGIPDEDMRARHANLE